MGIKEDMVALDRACAAYSHLFNQLSAVQSEQMRQQMVAEKKQKGEEIDESDELMPVFAAMGRIALVGADGSIMHVEVPVDKKLLKMASVAVLDQLGPLIEDVAKAATNLAEAIKQGAADVRPAART